MHPNEQLLTSFYEAFARRDYAAMQACYADNAIFSDPVFAGLNAAQVKAMWEMLCRSGKDLQLSSSDVRADEQQGSARWTASYTFSATGRKVTNRVRSSFVFGQGKIVQHTDHFSFHRWAGQALGLSGLLLGWTGFLRKKVQVKAMSNLRVFMERNS